MAKAASPAKFAAQVEKIRGAKARADAAVADFERTRQLLRASRAILHEIFFDHACLCRKQLPKLELAEASGITARAVQSLRQLHEIEEKHGAGAAGPPPAGLPEDLRAELERELQMLG